MRAVLLDRVTKVYKGGVLAVNDVSLSAEQGELLVLVGPSRGTYSPVIASGQFSHSASGCLRLIGGANSAPCGSATAESGSPLTLASTGRSRDSRASHRRFRLQCHPESGC